LERGNLFLDDGELGVSIQYATVLKAVELREIQYG